jgi:hypothetical protein
MLRFRALPWLILLAPLALACSRTTSQPCTSCDAGRADQPSDPVAADPSLDTDTEPTTDPDAPTVDQALAFDQGASETPAIDQGWPTSVDGSVDVPQPSPVPDGGVVLLSDFKDGTAEGWRTADWNDAGLPDSDWSVFLGDTGYVYSEGVLDKSEWHISFADSPAVADQIVEARMRVVEFYDAASSFVVALFARFDPSSDSGYFLALRGDGSVIIRKRLHGTSASWAPGVDAGLVPGTWYTVRLEVVGNTVNAFVDGKLVYSVVDSDPLATGTAALGSYGATFEVERIFLAQP